jgi:oligopeptide transport system substrate-binding protein
MSEQTDVLDLVMKSGKKLTARQASRRRFMQGLLASGAFATLAGVRGPSRALAQATPVTGELVPFSGPLAADQTIKMPTQEASSMDPGVSFGDYELDILWNIFEGLVGIDQRTNEIVPRVAESFDVNSDASQYTFHIRQGVTWSDGTPLNANDFEYSWKRVLDPDTASEYTGVMSIVKNAEKIQNGDAQPDDLGVKATDDNTLVVDLEGPALYFPRLAATWTFFPVPKHVIDAKGTKWVEAGNIVSNGPFVMTEWTHNQKITLEPNPNYYGDKPTLTKAEYTLFADASSQSYIAYENNELDYCEPEGPDLDRVLADANAMKEVRQFELSETFFIVCDNSNPPTDKVELRQALSEALDRATLANTVLNGQYEPAYSLLPTDIPGNNPDARLPEDVSAAQALLTKADIDPKSVTLSLTFIGNQFYTTVAQYVQATLQKNLGITITLAPIEEASYIDWRAARETEKFNIYTGSWTSDWADAANWFGPNFTTTNDHYRSHWSDPDFDALVAKADLNQNADERVQEYSQAEEMMSEQAPVIPILHGKAFRVIKPWVKDLFIQPIGSNPRLNTVKIAAH